MMSSKWICLMMKNSLLGGLLAIVLLSGCSSQLKLAQNFIERSGHASVAVYFPEKIITQSQRDAQDGAGAAVLDSLNQEAFLKIMYGAFSAQLKDYGLNLYQPDDPNDVQVDSVHWLVVLSRVEMQEKVTEYEDYVPFDGETYSYAFPLNTVNVASWFDLNDGTWSPTLFYEHNLIDAFDSDINFSFWLGQTDYAYAIDTLVVGDVYHYAVYLGKLYAGYTYDYMMNKYVGEQLKQQNHELSRFLRYDPYSKQVIYSEKDDRFIELKEE